MTPDGPVVADVRIFPIKSLDGTPVKRATIGEASGALVGDREFAIADADGEFLTGKRTAAVHRIQSTIDNGSITLDRPDAPQLSASLADGQEAIDRWLSGHFPTDVSLVRNETGGFPDDTHNHGPTVISTGTIRAVAGWYDGIGPESVRRRFRANIEIGGVEPFWEDRLIADEGRVIRFRIGDVLIDGVNPCARCVVPSRDPDTGEEYPEFRQIFIENRERTAPPWLNSNRFDHAFRLMVNTRVPDAGRGETIAVGDPITVVGERPD